MLRRVTLASALLASTALLSNSALAADIIEEPPPMFSWSGFYIGAHAGVVWNNNGHGCKSIRDILGEDGTEEFTASQEGCFEAVIDDSDSPNDGETVRAFELDDDFVAFPKGNGDDDDLDFLAGLQLGVNQQYGGVVVGLEADVSGLFGNNGHNNDFEYFHTETSDGDTILLERFEGVGRVSGGDIDWLATFRGRLGIVVGAEGRGMLYGTGGVAIAGVDELSGTFDTDGGQGWCSDGCFFRDGDNDIQVGFAVGVGGEWAWTDTVSFGAEFLHVNFGDGNSSDNLTFVGDDGRQFSFDNNLDDLNIVRVKLNLRFPPS